jgi:hypothetical protein
MEKFRGERVVLPSGKNVIIKGDVELIRNVFGAAAENIALGRRTAVTRKSIKAVAQATGWLRAGVVVVPETYEDQQYDPDEELDIASRVDAANIEMGRVTNLPRGEYKDLTRSGIRDAEVAESFPGMIPQVDKTVINHISELAESMPKDEAA